MGTDRDEHLFALMRLVAARDKAAFHALYHAAYTPLTRFLYRLLNRSDAVEELANDVMCVVWEKAGEFRGDSRVLTWIFGIAVHKSRRWRQQWYRQRELIAQQADVVVPERSSDAEEYHLDRGIAQLSAEHREAIELAYFCGYSCDEIAAIVGCPAGTVKTRLHYARKRLRELLAPTSSICGDTT